MEGHQAAVWDVTEDAYPGIQVRTPEKKADSLLLLYFHDLRGEVVFHPNIGYALCTFWGLIFKIAFDYGRAAGLGEQWWWIQDKYQKQKSLSKFEQNQWPRLPYPYLKSVS